jgi:NDP-sugar pyrophosphorylase family protein
MTISPTLLVLAAGMGSRYGGLKQIEPVGPTGETILDYSIYDALRAGFSNVVFIIRKAIEEPFRKTVGVRFENRIAVEYVFQELDNLPPGFSIPAGRTKPWGTTHAVLAAAEAIHEPFAVINADDFYGAESYRLLAEHLQSGTEDYAMVGFLLSNTLSDFGAVARGLCQVNSNGFLESVVELTHIERHSDQASNTDAAGVVTQLTGDEIVSMNMWGFTPKIFDQLSTQFRIFLEQNNSGLKSECYLPSAINTLLLSNQAHVKALRTSDTWFGVTYREDHAHVVDNIQQLIHNGLYPERLWS